MDRRFAHAIVVSMMLQWCAICFCWGSFLAPCFNCNGQVLGSTRLTLLVCLNLSDTNPSGLASFDLQSHEKNQQVGILICKGTEVVTCTLQKATSPLKQMMPAGSRKHHEKRYGGTLQGMTTQTLRGRNKAEVS